MKTVSVKLQTPYDIIIGSNLLSSCGTLISSAANWDKAALIADENTEIYAREVMRSLNERGHSTVKYIIPSGEASKSLETAEKITAFLSGSGVTRSGVVIALGGGTVGDVAGFAASVYMRGINLIHIPTTLLAMVDSSIGGKNAVNTACAKNIIGTIHQPKLVICDTGVLRTLPKSAIADGFAEIIKYGMLFDPSMLDGLERGMPEDLESLIFRCCEHKARIVAADERDANERRLLNFGHTFGHAMEHLSGYGLSHGSAVALGMVMMCRAAYRLRLCAEDYSFRLMKLIRSFGLDMEMRFNADALAEMIYRDKKNAGSAIDIIIPADWGACAVYSLPKEDIPALARFACEVSDGR